MMYRMPGRVMMLAAAAVASACGPSRARAQRSVPDSSDMQAAAAAANAQMSGMPGMSGMAGMAGSRGGHEGMGHDADPAHAAHMQMTSLRPANPADSARAARLVVQMRAALDRYRDVNAALADGYAEFLPNVPQQVYHFTSWRNAMAEAFRFDPAAPTSLLYRKGSDGSYTLVGAMYTEPRRAAERSLDDRIPLSVAQWHQHVNLCVPPRNESSRWAERSAGRPVFGPDSPIATEAACRAVGGRFIPHLFGWMVHANVFASDDPAVIWGHVH